MTNTDADNRWHRLSPAETAERLSTNPRAGLDVADAKQRLVEQGPNRLAQVKPRSVLLKFFDQFKSILIVILVLAAILAWAVGDIKDSVVILIVVLFNACLGFYQEYRAEKTLAALKDMLAARTRVKRGGQVLDIDAEDLVSGDLVLLEAGDRVPADGRLLAAHGLEVDEAALTGESHAVAKSLEAISAESPPLGDRLNLLYMNTVVTRGRAELLITATGMRTEMGKLAGMIAASEEVDTPLQVQLDVLGKRLAAIAVVVIVAILALDFWRGEPWAEAAMKAVALAVAAIPEGLPAVVTVTLAVGMWRMARNRAILKKLAAVETLGSTTVICSDKTGTLTLNQMTARAGWFAGCRFTVSGHGYETAGGIQCEGPKDLTPFLLPMAVCTESRVRDGSLIGDPTEGALYVLAQKGGLDPEAEQAKRPRVAEIPFDSAHKFMATFHQDDHGVEMFIKGAPDVLLDRCTEWLSASGTAPLTDQDIEDINAANAGFTGEALRVLAVARKRIPRGDFDPSGDLWQWSQGWEFLGLAGLMDPPRSEARDAIARCDAAGIRVKMITGDHFGTATAVGRELGLAGQTVSGADLDQMTQDDLVKRVDELAVFARVAPEHKVRIVQALRARGHVTAMTGDGVNDAPALKAADIGVAMGITGTEVTKEAATLVLTDDNFATIVRAVEEGRVIYDNIVKFVRFQLSTNIGAILTVLAATLLAMPTPFTPIQLLWINIIMDGPPAMTLGVEPSRPGIMQRQPRARDSQILSLPRLIRLFVFGSIMMLGTLYLFDYGIEKENYAYGLTLAFTTFVLFQFFNVFNARNEEGSAFGRHLFTNGKLWLALAGVVVMQVAVVHWRPAQEIFGTVDLSANDWLHSVAVASLVLLIEELRKLLLRARRG